MRVTVGAVIVSVSMMIIVTAVIIVTIATAGFDECRGLDLAAVDEGRGIEVITAIDEVRVLDQLSGVFIFLLIPIV